MFYLSVIVMINEYVTNITGNTVFNQFHCINSLSVALNHIVSDNIVSYNKLNMMQCQWNITVFLAKI